jgi:membrane protease YdiL (CAAX protease family)
MLKFAGIPVRPHIAIYLIQHVHSPDMVALLVFCGVVLAPIGEEIIFRWGLYRFARQHGSRWTAAALSSLVFGAVHWNLGLFLPIAAMGFALTIVYEKTGSLTASMAMHGLYNLNSLLAVYVLSR